MIVKVLERSIKRGFVGAIFDLGEHIFVASGDLTVEGGVDVFQLRELCLDFLRKLLINRAERGGLGLEGDAFGDECHAGSGQESSHQKICF